MKIEELTELINEQKFVPFCYREANDKNDSSCVMIHYLGFLIDSNVLNASDAQRILQEGFTYFLNQEMLNKRREALQTWLAEEPYESPYGFEDEDKSPSYGFDFEGYDDYEIG